jgi:hypothetical protein
MNAIQKKKAEWAFVRSLYGAPAEFNFGEHRSEFLKDSGLDVVLSRLGELGMTYQEMMLFAIIGHVGFSREERVTIVETGVRTGVSTRMLLSYLEMVHLAEGDLYSIDPMYRTTNIAKDKIVAACNGVALPARGSWTFDGRRSVDALLDIALKTGGWDVFLHDSDHSLECMTFELEFGWSMLRPGGMLFCNEWEFPKPNGVPHNAFLRFCKRRGLAHQTIGTAAVLLKPEDGSEEVTPIRPSPREMFRAAIAVAVEDRARKDPSAPPAYTSYLDDPKVTGEVVDAVFEDDEDDF